MDNDGIHVHRRKMEFSALSLSRGLVLQAGALLMLVTYVDFLTFLARMSPSRTFPRCEMPYPIIIIIIIRHAYFLPSFRLPGF
jgi:hypothetical protein